MEALTATGKRFSRPGQCPRCTPASPDAARNLSQVLCLLHAREAGRWGSRR
ncbi:hypothetical protein ACP70R_005044 [Stipagrostis hirtigluma subsp. patula]